MSPSSSKLVPLGKILQEWGIKGQVRFRSFNPESDLYPSLQSLYAEGEPKPYQLEQAKRHGRDWLFKLKGYENPEVARELRGKVLGLPREELPELAEGEYYIGDLLGMAVVGADGLTIGKIVGFLPVGDGDVMRIETEEGREVMVPYQKNFVLETQVKAGRILLTDLANDLIS